ncbi:MAG TPA: ABC transporter permease [Acidimicrobiia bacterium]|nr:ABC transporter permease [Acidimicrobiia bacterium]
MKELTGTAELIRFVIRRDRVRIATWVLSIVVLVWLTAASVDALFPTQADLDEAAAASEDNAAALAFNGPAQALDTRGGQVAFQVGAFGLLSAGLMSLFMVGRLTRGEEEAGRVELVRALPVGSRAPTAAALVTVAAMNASVGMLVTLALLGQGLPAPGSVTFGVSFTLLGLVFAGVAVVAAQVTENTRVVYGVTGAVLGAAFVVRAAGDVGDGTLSWFSPIGWAQKARPFAGERWWPFLLLVGAGAGLVVTAGAFAARRDLGGGLVAPRPGPAVASPGLGTPLGLATRLQRGSLIGWSAAVFLGGVSYGSIADSVDDFVADNEALADMLARVQGVDLTDSYLATSLRILAISAAGFAIQSVLRMRGEETSLRAEPVLATPVSRARWAGSHLAVAFGGSVVILALAGLATGLSYAAVGGDVGTVPELVGAALAYVPALWLLAGLAAALAGAAPRAIPAAWVALVACFVIGMLGELLGLPGWVIDLSPFEHVPLLPAVDLAVVPLLVLAAVAAALTGAGLAGLGRRDIG